MKPQSPLIHVATSATGWSGPYTMPMPCSRRGQVIARAIAADSLKCSCSHIEIPTQIIHEEPRPILAVHANGGFFVNCAGGISLHFLHNVRPVAKRL